MGEPELEQGLEGELETVREYDFFLKQIEVDWLDDHSYNGVYQRSEIVFYLSHFGTTYFLHMDNSHKS